ncbi:formate dehydrogenase subunit delta [Ideonella margarita]|uniref:Formate dehydrogenase subunit delta n=1 Tax=Ideonella margarita TaxID=2984191 RepID=A0ABU9C0Z3_9BURK
MDIANLVHMANRIGQFFEAMPDRAEALDGIANHIRKFWEPRMRRGLANALAAPETHELLPIVREALAARPDVLVVAEVVNP